MDIFIELTGGEAEDNAQTPPDDTPAADDAEGRESEGSEE